MVRARHGDEDAYALLVRERARPLLGVAWRILHDQVAAEDALQQALVTMWRELPRLRDPERFEAWSVRLVVNAALNQARADRRHRSMRVIPLVEPSIADSVRATLDRDALEGAFRQLSPEHRAVVVLHHHLGYSLGETAQILGIPYGTVGSRLHHALRELRSTLTREERLARHEGRSG
ncbi:MAG: sigma-70 family RNA polymerase sigma factor [Chloroflexota bacterium]